MNILGFGVGVGMKLKVATASPAGPSFPSTGLVAAWSFDDTLTDSVGSKVLTASGGNSYVTGKLGTKALQLTAGNIVSVDTGEFDFVADPMTVAFWVKEAAASNFMVIYVAAGSVSWQAGSGASDVTVQAADGGYFASDAYTVPDDTWTLVVLRFSAATGLTVNVNARSAVMDNTCTSLGDYGSGTLQIGSDGTVAFDAFYVWKVRLSDQNVTDLFNGGAGLTP